MPLSNRVVFEGLRYLAILLAIVIALIPIAWMATMAFKPVAEWTTAIAEVTWLPKNPTLGNFEYIFTGETEEVIVTLDRIAIRPILSSLLIASFGTLIAVFAGTLGAYGVSRFAVGRNLPLGVLQLRLFRPSPS